VHEQVEEPHVAQGAKDHPGNLTPVACAEIPPFTEEVSQYAISRPMPPADVT
jgi:hypothetical protein